jgi:L-alanine-DL-glutamate epimerase-like enolase superfamily enzyme
MKITALCPILLSYKYKEDEIWGWSGGEVHVWNTTLVEVHTDEGIKGLGEMGTGHYMPEVCREITKFLEKTLIGCDPFEINVIYEKLYRLGANWGRRGIAMGVISGIENALWDLKGKALGLPVHSLLGGKINKKIRAYASGGMEKPISDLIDEVKGYLDRGFTAVKIRGGHDLDRDRKRIKALRKELGYDFDLMLDCGQGYVPKSWSVAESIEVIKSLEEFKLFFIEEPIRTDYVECYAKVHAASKTQIAGGENGCSIFEFKPLIDHDAVDIIQPDVTHAGGIGEVKRISDYADLYGKTVAPHVFRSAASLSAHLHLLATIPNALICEYQQIANPLREALFIEPLKIENGYFIVPDLPGLGIYINEKIINQFHYLPGYEQRFKVEKV